MIACVAIVAIVALVLYALGAPAGVFAFVIICPVMMIATRTDRLVDALRPRGRF
jgi:hypothetical protein